MSNRDEKPHLSPSQIGMFTRCGEQWRRRYIERDIIPPGMAAVRGKSIHAAAAFNSKQKITSRQDLPAKEIVEVAAASFEAEVKGGYSLTPEEQAQGVKTVLGDTLDATIALAQAHAELQAPDYQPVMVEERVRIELPKSSHDLLGVLDLVDDKDAVIDYKNASKRKSQSEADSSVQLTTYQALFKAKTGRLPSRISLDVLVNGKKEIKRQVLTSTRTDRDLNVLAARINAVTSAIQAGVFVPAEPGNWYCSAKWCGYAPTCPYFNADRRPSDSDE